jgi:DNA-binding LacI/PurR family transcriptional regulator
LVKSRNDRIRPAVTSSDVARKARVSQSAVSRTFTTGASVSQATRAKVMKAATELGYRPNALARAMISGRSRLVAMVVAYLDNHFYPIVVEKLARAVQARDYHLLMFMTEPGRQDEVVRQILAYRVEGIVMASATLSSTLARECAETGIPVVMLNRYVASIPASSVVSDNDAGGRALAEFLVAGGHKRIAYIAGAEDASTNRDREAGFRDGLARHGVSIAAREVGGYSFQGASEAMRALWRAKHKPDAVFVANDHMAFAAMDTARTALGLRIPEDVSIVGYDDVPEAAWAAYGLTTVRQSSSAMVAATVDILFDQIESGAVRKRLIVQPASLVVRSSARRPPAA